MTTTPKTTPPTTEELLASPLPSQLITFGEKLRAAREVIGLTQQEAAEQVGQVQSQWSALELGLLHPDVTYRRAYKKLQASHARLQAIASAVNTTVDHLIG